MKVLDEELGRLGAGVVLGAVVVVAVVWQRVLASEPQQAAPTDRNRSPTDWLNAADVYQLVDSVPAQLTLVQRLCNL